MFKAQFKNVYILIFLLFYFISSSNAQTNIYVVTASGEVRAFDVNSLKILGDGYGFGIIGTGSTDYDGFKTIYGATMSMNNWIIFDIVDLNVKKTIVEELYEGIIVVLFNPVKKHLYVAAENDKKESGTLVYSINYNEKNEPEIAQIQQPIFIKNDFLLSVERQITSDGEFVYSMGTDENNKLVIKKTDTQIFGSVNFSLPQSVSSINNIILSKDNRRLYANMFIQNQGIKELHELIIDANNGSLIKDLVVESNSLVLSNNGGNLYYVNVDKNNNITLVKINTTNFTVENISLGNYTNVSNNPIVLSPDNSILIVGKGSILKGKGYITVIDLNTKQIKGQIEINTYPVAIYFK